MTTDAERHRRRSIRYGVAAAVLCPCHLPLVASILGLVGLGGTAAALRENLWLVAAVLVPLTAGALWLAVRSGRQARTCALPPPPVATSTLMG